MMKDDYRSFDSKSMKIRLLSPLDTTSVSMLITSRSPVNGICEVNGHIFTGGHSSWHSSRFTLFLSYLHGSNNLETQPHDTSFLPSFRSILPIILPVLPSLSSCLTFILSFPSCLSALSSWRYLSPWHTVKLRTPAVRDHDKTSY